jgi:integrase
MLNNGVPLEVVSANLGHAGIGITADVYAKVRIKLQREAAAVMDDVLGQAGRSD